MCKILLSINPEHVKSIFNGTKKFEYRKTECKKPVDKIIIYSTSPVMMVVGEAEVKDIIINSPKEIWRITKKQSGISKNFFDSYYFGKEKAVAYQLYNVHKYKEPLALKQLGVNNAPQSYIYLE